MPTFRYKAIERSGGLVVGQIDAADRRSAIARVHALGQFPISAEPDADRRWLSALTAQRSAAKPSLKNVALITRELAALISAGLTVDRALHVLVRATADDDLRRLLGQILERVREGDSLSEALDRRAGLFPPFFSSTIQAAERGGFLGPALFRLAEFTAKSQALREGVRSAMVYPVILMAMTAVSIAVIVAVVLPSFSGLFADAGIELPLLLRIATSAGTTLETYPLLFAAAAGAAALGLRIGTRSEGFKVWRDAMVLKAPILRGVVVGLDAARLTRNLGMLLENGIVLSAALPLTAGVISNSALRGIVSRTIGSVREGHRLADGLAKDGLFPAATIEIIRVGEETGQLVEMLRHAADLLDDEVRRTVERCMSLLVPTTTVVFGLIVAALLMSMISVLVGINDLAV